MFNLNNVNVIEKVNDWEESIRICSQKMLENGSIKEEYIESMIEKIHKLGFYVVIDKYIAMPHSRTENGVIKNDISFLKVNEGVYYGNEIIYLIFSFSASNSNSHIDMLQKLIEIFQNEEVKERLIKEKTKEGLLKILGGI